MVRATNKILFMVLPVMLFLAGCDIEVQRRNVDKVLAQVGLKYLYLSELKRELPSGLEPADSSLRAQEYINNWIKQQLLLIEVDSKLPANEKDIGREIEKYRQELLIHKFKNLNMERIVENTVPYDEIEKVYLDNLERFKLHRIIVRVSYSIFPEKINPPKRIKDLLTSTDVDDLGEVEDYMFKYAKRFDNFNDSWIYFDNLLESVNYGIDNETSFLRRNKIVEFEQDGELHLIAVKQYMMPGAQAPLDFVAPRIRAMIINQRKLDFLREIKDSLYEEALKYNKFRLLN